MAGQQALALLMGVRILLSQKGTLRRSSFSGFPFGCGGEKSHPEEGVRVSELPSDWRTIEPLQSPSSSPGSGRREPPPRRGSSRQRTPQRLENRRATPVAILHSQVAAVRPFY